MRKMFYSSTELITNDSGTYKAFESMHQNVIARIENFSTKDLIDKAIA